MCSPLGTTLIAVFMETFSRSECRLVWHNGFMSIDVYIQNRSWGCLHNTSPVDLIFWGGGLYYSFAHLCIFHMVRRKIIRADGELKVRGGGLGQFLYINVVVSPVPILVQSKIIYLRSTLCA